MGKTWLALALLLAVAILSSTLIFGCTSPSKSQSREIAAMVNGEKIYFDDVTEYYNAYMTLQQRATMTKSDALSLVIEREILYQEATKQGFTATSVEMNNEYKSYLSANNLSESRFSKELVLENSSITSFKTNIGKRIVIGKLLSSVIPSNFVIKHEDVEAVYNASTFAQQNVSFDDAQQSIIDYLTSQKQQAAQDSYILGLKDKSQVLVVGVPD